MRVWDAAVLMAAMGMGAAGHAATFNVQFNNNEQGANSHSTSSVVVGEKQASKSLVTSQAGEAEKAAPVAEAPAQVTTTTVQTASVSTSEGESRWRFGLSAFQGEDWSKFSTAPRRGPMLTFALAPMKTLAFQIFGGMSLKADTMPVFGGGEVEITPLRLTVFKFTDLFELGVMAGFSSLHASESDERGSFHAGARLGVNLGEHWAVNAVVRANPSWVLAEVGLGIRL